MKNKKEQEVFIGDLSCCFSLFVSFEFILKLKINYFFYTLTYMQDTYKNHKEKNKQYFYVVLFFISFCTTNWRLKEWKRAWEWECEWKMNIYSLNNNTRQLKKNPFISIIRKRKTNNKAY